MKRIFIAVFTLWISMAASAQVRVGDIVLPQKITFGEEELTLNGAGMRSVIGIDTYSGGLYTQKKYDDPKVILDSDESMSIRLNIASKRVTNTRMAKVFRKGFEDATFGNTSHLDARIEDFLKLFAVATQVNDYFDLVYTKGKGISTYKNGVKVGDIEGRDFKYALFKIWLGDEPACKLIKGGMLGSNE